MSDATGIDANEPANATVTPSAVEWDQSRMQTMFANVVNVQSTREQFDLFFGTNRTWNTEQRQPVTVALENRIMLTPFAAKRLAAVLGNVIREYEARYGLLDIT